eukprot:TRINITY_DN9418_c0_g1_i1.p1 TRINITY_DN9418_c0_g1~~TRINITY_DN9418_c0_g1_i1.p1  ORF type:complete len:335 (+),score=56.70 TRINITY_DN9418_c0_g1_i1:699-1703(+)
MHKAALIPEKFGQIIVKDVPTHPLREGEVLIRNRAVGTNPVDWKIQRNGILAKEFPVIFGMDLAGIVESVGEGVTQFHKGDRVAGIAPVGPTNFDHRHGAFQELSILPAARTQPIPSNISFETMLGFLTGFATALVGFYLDLGIPQPKNWRVRPPLPSDAPFLFVNGGSSSVGSAAIQLALLSGLKVIATASPKNFELVKSFGASHVFDYKDPDLISKVKAVADQPIKYGFECAASGDEIKKSIEIVGEGHLATALFPPQDANSRITLVQAVRWHTEPNFANEIIPHLNEAIEAGTLLGLPWEVVGNGLDDIQKALDYHASGNVSGTKPIIRLE